MVNRLLDKAQRLFKVDIRYVLRGNFWLNINRGMSVLNGIALSVAFAHLLTKESYGTYAFALAIIGLFSMGQNSGLGSGIIKNVARGEYGVVFEGLRKILPWSIGGAIGLAGVALYYFVMGNTDLAICFLLGAIVLPTIVSNGISKSFFSSRGDFKVLTRFNIVRTPFMTLALVSTAFFTSSAVAVVSVSIIGNTLMGFLLYSKMKKAYALTPDMETVGIFPKRYAFHSGVLSIFSYFSEQIDNILLWKFMGAAPVAIYSYAMAPVRELRGLAENQGALALPKFAQKEFGDVRKNIFLRIKQMYIVIVPLVIVYILSAPIIFHTLFPTYTESIIFSQFAALSILSAPRRLMSVAIVAHQKIKESYIMIVLPSTIRIITASILIPFLGLKGAVIALLVSEVIDYVVLGIMMRVNSQKDIQL